MNPTGLGKLAINFITSITKFTTTWQVTGSLCKASSFNSLVNYRSDESAINQLNGNYSGETLKNDSLNEIRKRNSNCFIIAYLNINSIWKKFEMLKEVIGNKIDILLLSEIKLDDTFLLSKFILEEFTPP